MELASFSLREQESQTRQAERHFGMRLFSLGRRSPLLAVPGKGQKSSRWPAFWYRPPVRTIHLLETTYLSSQLTADAFSYDHEPSMDSGREYSRHEGRHHAYYSSFQR